MSKRYSDPFYTVTYYMKWGKTSWSYSMLLWNINWLFLIVRKRICYRSSTTTFNFHTLKVTFCLSHFLSFVGLSLTAPVRIWFFFMPFQLEIQSGKQNGMPRLSLTARNLKVSIWIWKAAIMPFIHTENMHGAKFYLS